MNKYSEYKDELLPLIGLLKKRNLKFIKECKNKYDIVLNNEPMEPNKSLQKNNNDEYKKELF